MVGGDAHSDPRPVMTSEEVAACTGVTLRQLRHWNKLGLVGPKPRGQGVALKWSFSDAVKVAIVGELRSFSVPLSRCARIIASIPPGPMAKTKLVAGPHESMWMDEVDWQSPYMHQAGVLVVRPGELIDRLMEHLAEDDDEDDDD